MKPLICSHIPNSSLIHSQQLRYIQKKGKPKIKNFKLAQQKSALLLILLS